MEDTTIASNPIESLEENFDPEKFVDSLLNEGAKIACDETEEAFNEHNCLPPFYDEEKFVRGQQFFHKHIFANFLGKMLGLITILTVPTILRLLIYTKMSSTSKTAYKRYMATVFHMVVWYDYDFKPGSRMWESIKAVRCLHNSASRRGVSAGLNGINQRDMALTQFGFMGYAVSRSEQIGIHAPAETELENFIHVWRVIGYIMGIQDRFNICRESVEETKQICELLIQRVFKPQLELRDPQFLEMSRYLVEGMWSMSPFLSHPVLLCFLYKLLNKSQNSINNNNNNNNNNKADSSNTNGGEFKLFTRLNFWGKFLLNFFHANVFLLQYSLFRLYNNFTMHRSLWLMKYFPFLAYYQFGYRNSRVCILDDSSKRR